MNQYRDKIFNNIVKAIATKLPKGPCIEIGCGNGRYLIPISLEMSQSIIGIDLKPPKDKSLFKFIQGDAQLLPFGDDSFVGAYMIQSIHQYANWKKALLEVKRILKKEGLVIIHTLSHIQLSEVFTLKFTPEALQLDLARYPGIDEIQSHLLKLGFKDIEIEEIKNTRNFRRSELIKYIETRANSAFRRLYETHGEVWFQNIVEIAKKTIPNTSILAEPHNSTLITARRIK